MQLTRLTAKSINEILNIERNAKKFDIKNIKKFLKKIGNPERQLKIIHVAGTNGKGSVCAMISSVLSEADYKVGMYTSPHLIKINERIKINNRPISNNDLERLNRKLSFLQRKYKVNLTFFETLTALAYLYFKEKNAEYVVLETGMGGRLDATNTASPIISIITNIGLEHTDILGKTIKKIAKEKAGIIKPRIPIVTNAKGIALKVIKDTAKKQKSPLIKAKKTAIRTNLKGDFQSENSAVAVAALRQLGINEKCIRNGLKKVYWPGRFEFIKKNILIDCAHNPDAIKALVASVKKLKYNKLIVIIGVMKDKNIRLIAKSIMELNPSLILTKANVDRAMAAEKMKKYFKNSILTADIKQAIEQANKLKQRNDLILITGSIYLVGEAYSFLSRLQSLFPKPY